MYLFGCIYIYIYTYIYIYIYIYQIWYKTFFEGKYTHTHIGYVCRKYMKTRYTYISNRDRYISDQMWDIYIYIYIIIGYYYYSATLCQMAGTSKRCRNS